VTTTLQQQSTRPSRPTGTARGLRSHVIAAVCGRDFQGYFNNPAGYVFITLFVFVCSWAAFWQPVFFANNLANLDPLNVRMPYLLLFFLPAITMTAWAEERQEGTDELLLTLPARDVEVVLGKYLAALGIYTVALVFLALGHVPILSWLGRPDAGVLASTYLGYWLMGAMLIAVGMAASMISGNATVAFILGTLFCAIPVFLDLVGSSTGSAVRRQLEALSVPAQFRDFGAGVVPLSGLLYFGSLAAAMLYLNMVLLGRRHWAGGQAGRSRWGHAMARVVAVVVALAGLNAMVARGGIRTDLSQEGLNTLSAESIALLKQIPSDRPVFIQAYYSPEVPREYVETKANLLSLLKEYAARGGSRIRLNLVETELYSDQARDAQKRFGIEPRKVFTSEEARQDTSEVFLGVAFTSGVEEVVIPFFDRGLPVEYELTRSIRVVSKSGRKKVGILATDAKLLGGFDFQSMGQSQEWSVVTELKKQYDVTSIPADTPIPANIDALLVAQPSSLNQQQVDNLTRHVRAGRPTLLLVDPLPLVDPQLSPELPKPAPGGMFGGGQPPEPKGDLKPLLDLLGVEWPVSEIVWSSYNPHPQLGDLPPEIVFVGRGDAGESAFNPKQPVASGLQELVMMFPGRLRSRPGSGPNFTPLLETGESGGTIAWNEVIQPSPFGGPGGMIPVRSYLPTRQAYTLAALIEGKPAAAPAAPPGQPKPAEPAAVKAIVVADLDMISEQFFDLRRRKIESLEFDNVTFVLNCVDTLAGDDAFIGLRKRRPRHRTLETLELQAKAFVKQSQDETKAAEDAAKEKLESAQKRLDEKVAGVRARKDMDARTKDIMLANLQEVESRRLEVDKANIDDEKRRKLQESKGDKERKIKTIQNQVRVFALLLPPLPALVLGMFVFGGRLARENRGANPNRIA